jgi:hypothetical protein
VVLIVTALVGLVVRSVKALSLAVGLIKILELLQITLGTIKRANSTTL